MQGGARAALFNTQTHERQKKIKLLAEVRATAGSGYKKKKSKEEAELEGRCMQAR